jgi:hypothetical protein
MPQSIPVSIGRRLIADCEIRAARAWPLEFLTFPLDTGPP